MPTFQGVLLVLVFFALPIALVVWGVSSKVRGKEYKSPTKEELALRLDGKKIIVGETPASLDCSRQALFYDDLGQVALRVNVYGKYEAVRYEDIIGYEFVEDGETVVKGGGIGRAVVGGALFGGAGAVVGAVTGKREQKAVCSKLQVIVTVKGRKNPMVALDFLSSPTKKDGMLYRSAVDAARLCVSKLAEISDERDRTLREEVQKSSSEEIREMKSLCDEGVITQEEFDAKKKQLLGL